MTSLDFIRTKVARTSDRNGRRLIRVLLDLLVETDAVYGNTTLTEAGDDVSYLTINRDKLCVPADRSDDWVWVRSFREPYESFSAEGEALA